MSTYLYSFIIPHKNSPSLLQRCISSIPDRDDIEIIVVDDNSDDNSKPNVERNNVSIICLDALNSQGAGHARNVGLSHAKGKWVLFIDADDAYSPHIADLLDKYKNADVDVVYFGHAKIIDKGKKIANVWPTPEELDKDPQYVSKYFRKVPWNKMVKREFIEQHQIHFEECPVGNDIFYSYQVGYYSGDSFEFYLKPVYHYYVNDGSIIHKKKNTEQFYVTVFKHEYQCNEFKKLIGYKRYNRSILVKFVSIWWKNGFSQLLFALKVYLSHYAEIMSDRMLYVNYFEKNKL